MFLGVFGYIYMTIENREKDKAYFLLLSYAFVALGTFLTPFFYWIHAVWLAVVMGILVNNHNRNVGMANVLADLAKDKAAALAYKNAMLDKKTDWDEMTQVYFQRALLAGIGIDYVVLIGLIAANYFLSK